MREVKAIIRPQRLEGVMEALHDIPGVPGVTVSKVHAYAGSTSDDPKHTANAPETDFTKLEIIVPASLVERVVAAIEQAGHTGRAGDGVVIVLPVEQFVRIRDVGRPDSAASTATSSRSSE